MPGSSPRGWVFGTALTSWEQLRKGSSIPTHLWMNGMFNVPPGRCFKLLLNTMKCILLFRATYLSKAVRTIGNVRLLSNMSSNSTRMNNSDNARHHYPTYACNGCMLCKPPSNFDICDLVY